MDRPICPDKIEHGEMMKNGTRGGKQMWLCQKCGASKVTKTISDEK